MRALRFGSLPGRLPMVPGMERPEVSARGLKGEPTELVGNTASVHSRTVDGLYPARDAGSNLDMFIVGISAARPFLILGLGLDSCASVCARRSAGNRTKGDSRASGRDYCNDFIGLGGVGSGGRIRRMRLKSLTNNAFAAASRKANGCVPTSFTHAVPRCKGRLDPVQIRLARAGHGAAR